MKTVGIIITLAIFTILPLAAAASDMVTIEGEMNDNFQIVDSNGQVYEIADSAQGNSYAGQKVRVTGTLQENEDGRIIIVTSFTIITE
jgi:hypothetical protein